MRETIDRMKPEMREMLRLLQGEAEVLRHMSCEQCLLKARAEKLEKAAGRLKSWMDALDVFSQQD